ncbi:tRNA1(Val) (adenine(37)-N6)-methyltransferase [Pelagibacterium xiamenense]|uniref:tRNA1(Val) (adenine(37)-N6)-methyltransferase n=1 Tax=Pelagibacterium xiamenense TaxID=2901140 RepID=UPI001E444AF5|nr:methyltransferase [Pelagibacterium xiamenense]MCD7059285.1 methyltransferase [Pelagibacterium xiamenense]
MSICQPKGGFRAGLDSVLLGASVPPGTGKLLDMGAGAGVAGLVALAHGPDMRVHLAEIDADMAALARTNADGNGFGGHVDTLVVDVTAPGAARTAAGLETDIYDVIIANPPYFGNGTLAPDGARARARHMNGAAIEAWVKTAVSSGHAHAEVIFIHTVSALPHLLAAFTARMGAVTVLPIAARPETPASRVLISGRKGSRAPLTLLPPLVLHGATGNAFLPHVDAVFRGNTALDWRNAG